MEAICISIVEILRRRLPQVSCSMSDNDLVMIMIVGPTLSLWIRDWVL
jgi:hypothetical protein